MLGPYEIRGELGRGAMAVVWRAWDTRLEREVAIKEPLTMQVAGEAISAEFAERFVREGKAAAGLNHPGIVTIYNADVFDGRPVIVMELIEGRCLGDVVGDGPMPSDFAVSVADQLLDALGYAHSRGVVHRDVKPDNIFVLPDGRVKLSDFGIAHVESSQTLTQAGTVMGTPGYMAPEQVTGSPVDARTDLFAVGVIAYEMLTGANPFGSTVDTTPTAIMFRVVQHEPPDLADVAGSSIAPHLCEAVRVAMAKDPAYRFSSADAMRRALRGEPVETAASAGVASPGAPTIMAGSAFPTHSRPVAVAPPADTSRNTAVWAVAGTVGVAVIAVALVVATRPVPGTTATAQPGGAAVPTQTAAAAPAAPQAAPEPAPIDTAAAEAEVRKFVEGWRQDWEGEELSNFLAHYDTSSFYAAYKSKDYREWREYIQTQFNKYDITEVTITNPQVDIGPNGLSATAAFDQVWRTSSGTWDEGPKTLTLSKESGRWLIVGEEWAKTAGSY